jgi:Guanosine polyphosphate pyrophosphohydrolases/synthetases
LTDNRQFMDSVKLDLFHDVVYVFTPKGIVKELPRGSTPVDFAFAIHTEVGDHCVGAKVDGKIVPLKHQLASGDTVEILTSPTQSPHKDWLKFVRTSVRRPRSSTGSNWKSRSEASRSAVDYWSRSSAVRGWRRAGCSNRRSSMKPLASRGSTAPKSWLQQ